MHRGEDPDHEAALRSGGARGRPAPARDRLGRAGPVRRRSSRRSSRPSPAPTHAVATSSCTTALHIAVAALGLKPGDEVIVPGFTWVSTANVVEYMGATPVFCDIDLADVQHRPGRARSGDHTADGRDACPVHLFGLCADMEPILEHRAAARDLWVVEDARLRARRLVPTDVTPGRSATWAASASIPRKSITTGEGGMITTGERAISPSLARSLRDHGASRSDHARHTRARLVPALGVPHLGYNFRMTDIQGALGCCADGSRRGDPRRPTRAALALYDEQLWTMLGGSQTPAIPDGYVHGYQAYVCLFRPGGADDRATSHALHEQRNELMMRLEERGIATRQGTHSRGADGLLRGEVRVSARGLPERSLGRPASHWPCPSTPR